MISDNLIVARRRRSGGAALREVPADEDLRALIRDVIREAAEEGDIGTVGPWADVVRSSQRGTIG